MAKRKMLVSGNEAKVATKQHTKPCGDCPWRRNALPGWLGTMSADEWIQAAHSDAIIDCHTKLNMQCAGAATYRGNVCKMPRDPKTLKLPADREHVFANPMQFKEYHSEFEGT